MITIYWHCLTMREAEETFVAEALKELAQHLKAEPIKLDITLRRLGDESELAKKIGVKLDRLNDPSYGFKNCANEIINTIYRFFEDVLDLGETVPIARLLVYCARDSHLAMAALTEKPSNLWGSTSGDFSTPTTVTVKNPSSIFGAPPGFFAAVYEPNNKFVIWHETLHLLGLDECYDENTLRRNCNCDTCIMQFEPDEKWGGKWSLCGKIIGFLQDLSKNCRENKQG